MENRGVPKTYLGVNIEGPDPYHISMDQSAYIDRTLTRFRMQDAKPERLPLNPSIKLIPAAFENGRRKTG
jgi:hypothetical protein